MNTDGRKAAAVLNPEYCPRICRERLNETPRVPIRNANHYIATFGGFAVIEHDASSQPARNPAPHSAALLNPAPAFADARIIIISTTQSVRHLQDDSPNGWLPTAALLVWSQVGSCGICGGRGDRGRFCLNTSVSTAYPHSLEPELVEWAHQWPIYQVDSISPHPTKCNII